MDVKFPLAAYLRYLDAGTDAERSAHLDAFLRDVRLRVRELAGRDYAHQGDQPSVDYVLLFLPNETLSGFIHEHDPGLIDDALGQRVVLCSPLTLFAVLGVIRQAFDNFMVEETSEEILGVLGAFEQQWDSSPARSRRSAPDRLGAEGYDDRRHRKRALERPLARLASLRTDRGIGVDESGTCPTPTSCRSKGEVSSGVIFCPNWRDLALYSRWTARMKPRHGASLRRWRTFRSAGPRVPGIMAAMSQPALDLEFDDGADPTFTVGELADAVNQVLRRGFRDGVWVRGEIEGIQQRNGHVYFSLTDHTDDGRASIAVALFANTWYRLRPVLARHRLRLANGLAVRIHAVPNLYAPTGRLSLVMDGIDVRFTLGKLAADRDALLARLTEAGVVGRNAGLAMPPCRCGSGWSPAGAAPPGTTSAMSWRRAASASASPTSTCGCRAPTRRRPSLPPCARCRGVRSTSSWWFGVAARAPTWPPSTTRPSRWPSPGRRCRCSPASGTRSTAAWPTTWPTPPTRRRRRAPPRWSTACASSTPP
jgi:hypothetical protein